MTQKICSNEYLVISRGQWDLASSKEDIQVAIDDFYVWLEKMIADGKMRTGSRLGNGGATVSRERIVSDGPYGETKEVIGGYWFILADNLEDATRLAASNPCMKHGLFFEIRPLEPERASAFAEVTENIAERQSAR